MKIILRDFQEEAASALTRRLDQARREWRADGQLQAVGLAAPTGSGKTVIATAVIERILFGGPDSPPHPSALFLWLTDQPELNLQTRNKMLTTSSSLTPDRLVVIENIFDAPALSPGLVYFLNTQKLAERASLVQPTSDLHITPFWDTVNSTIDDGALALYVVIDEAHRGMVENPREREQATSIMQRFIKGCDEMRPAPIVLGISATPQRYEAVIAGTARTSRPYAVPPEVVRDSGLLKERIVVSHAGEAQAGDMTLLRAAARSWQEMTEAWGAYCAQQREPSPVIPAFVVQVEDERGNAVSATPIAAVIRAIREEVPGLPDTTFVHALQDHADLPFGDTTVRYVAPSDIADDADARVVFFKKSLNAGWDCPRAEVMFSFRRAADYTNIAQLIGRMVRAPLTRSITEDERLNAVGLFLPYYNTANVRTVVEYLTGAGEAAAAIEVVEADKIVMLPRAAGSEAAFAALEALPNYIVPRARKTSDVRRLDALARALAIDEIDPEATGRERGGLVDVLLAARVRLADDPSFTASIAERGTITVRRVEWIYGETQAEDEAAETLELLVSEENVAALFAAAGRSLGGEVHHGYWQARADAVPGALGTARLELVALAMRDEVRVELDAVAQARIRELFGAYGPAIEGLPAGRRSVYTAIHGSSAVPERIAFRPPNTTEFPVGEEAWQRHLYTDASGQARIELGSAWETEALRVAIAVEDTVGWLRNVPRKEWSFCVPYLTGGEWRAMYPDFLVVRRGGEALRVDICDPHNPDLRDAHDKAKGMAKFAADHGYLFGRIEVVAKVGNRLVSLDLKDERTRERIFGAESPAALKAIFST